MTVTAFPSQTSGEHPEDAIVVAEWADWLRARLDHDWRSGEWDAGLLLFTGDPRNPRTSVGVCEVPGCGVTIQTQSLGYCATCGDAYRRSGMTKEDFDAAYSRQFHRANVTRAVAECEVPTCARKAHGQGLCVTHYRSWVKARNRPGIDRTAWMVALKPSSDAKRCRVLACPRERVGFDGLCRTHHHKWRHWSASAGVDGYDEGALARWAERQAPVLAAHVFSLAPLSPLARLELLYVLQRRDVRGVNLSPQAVRGAIDKLAEVHSIALAAERLPDPAALAVSEWTRSLLTAAQWEITTAFDEFRGVDPTRKLVWDLRTVSQMIPSLKKGVSPLRHISFLDFSEVRQKWLREALMHWARTASPTSQDLRRRHKACVVASRELHLRPGGGTDPGKLQFSDMTAVVEGFKRIANATGEVASTSHQGHLLACFFDLLEFGRRDGVLDNLSPRFTRHPSLHTIKRVDENEDEIGKALPDIVIQQLDQHIHLLGKDFPYGDLSPEAVNALFRTAYVILRDTGRRPAEVAGLDLDCLEFDSGEYQLVWHNMKGRRKRRRLPILQQTADAINDWKQLRAELNLPGNSADHLFPAVTNRYRNLDSGNLSRVIRSWVDSIPVLDSEELGPDGTPFPFDRSKIFPYAFRHTFCQRYADAGVQLHVLQSLMDHRSANTTSAYYTVSKKMKRAAVDTLRVHTLDRSGNPAPMASLAAYEVRSVAVPWGNCVEPSNVKAGGKACPIRFQCSGCASYRPDPSHLPSIEDQVRSLKANLELARAMGAADYTIRGMEGEIADYQNVITTMRAKLEAMSDEERREIEEASRILRRLRAGAATNGPVALPMPVVRSSSEDGR